MAKTARLAVLNAEERRVREDLAALYRCFVHYGWTDLLATHISARVPGASDQYLINPYGLFFEEVTASNLLKVDFDGRVLEGEHPYNEAGHLIHSAVLKARPEINFVLHSHTRAGVAVSTMKDGLLPLSQHAGTVLGTLAYHDYQVVTDAEDECELLARDLGEAYLMLLRNHGILACGRSAGEAFVLHYDLEAACKIQVDALRAGVDLVMPPAEAIEDLKDWGRPQAENQRAERTWTAILRRLERREPDYRD